MSQLLCIQVAFNTTEARIDDTGGLLSSKWSLRVPLTSLDKDPLVCSGPFLEIWRRSPSVAGLKTSNTANGASSQPWGRKHACQGLKYAPSTHVSRATRATSAVSAHPLDI